MRKILTSLIVIPLALLFIVFAVANRHFVTVSFDPFNSIDPSISLSMPLFALIILAAIFGVVAGGAATWFRQRRWRRAARQHEADARTARAQLAEMRTYALSSRPTLPPQSGSGASGRDKYGATL